MSRHRAGTPRWATRLRFGTNLALLLVAVLLGYCAWLGQQPIVIVYVK